MDQQFFVLLDRAGQLASKIEAEFGRAAPVVQQDDRVAAAWGHLAQLSKALAALEAWGKGQQKDVAALEKLPAGRVVADVAGTVTADGVYTGPVDVNLLSLPNLRFIADHMGAFSNKWGQVFKARVRFPDDPGLLANGDRSSIVREADGAPVADLSTWVAA